MSDDWKMIARHGDTEDQVRAALLAAHRELLVESKREWMAMLLADEKITVPLAMQLVEQLAAEADRIAAAQIDTDLAAYLLAMKLTAGGQRLISVK